MKDLLNLLIIISFILAVYVHEKIGLIYSILYVISIVSLSLTILPGSDNRIEFIIKIFSFNFIYNKAKELINLFLGLFFIALIGYIFMFAREACLWWYEYILSFSHETLALVIAIILGPILVFFSLFALTIVVYSLFMKK